jgi:diguanylate cyclase (GGDEF)-like protein/PAS domain S-box-containing protein
MTDARNDAPGTGSSSDDLEHLCIRNLLAAQEERFFFKDLESRFVMVSDGWRAAVGRGLALDEVIGKTDFDFFTRPHASAAFEDEQRIIQTSEPILAKIERETFANRPDEWVSTSKYPMRDARGAVIGTFGVSRDVTAQMRDATTGLANRMALMDRLRQALAALDRQPGRVALLFVDIDNFKQINDTWGHRAGDLVLAEIGSRLNSVSRRFDTVARYGGDEFVLLLTAMRADENLHQIGERLIRAVSSPIDHVGDGVTLHVSIGAVMSHDPAADAMSVLEAGDAAMYAAKREGGARLVIYDADVHGPSEGARADSDTDPDP